MVDAGIVNELPTKDTPKSKCVNASSSYQQAVSVGENEHLVTYLKSADVPESVTEKDRLKKAETKEDAAQPLNWAIMQSAANIEARLMTGKLKYSTVIAPELSRKKNR